MENKNSKYIKVQVVSDDSGHWYIIPNELKDQFYIDSENEKMCDSGQFEKKYDSYRTGGCINNIQLYINV